MQVYILRSNHVCDRMYCMHLAHSRILANELEYKDALHPLIPYSRICDNMSARRGLGELLSLTSKHIGAFEGSILHKVSSLHTTSRAIGSTANSSVWSGDVRHGMGRQLQSLRGFASGMGLTLYAALHHI
jgi:hypothetical protein